MANIDIEAPGADEVDLKAALRSLVGIGAWTAYTPSFTFATPGDVAISTAGGGERWGIYKEIDGFVEVHGVIRLVATTGFTHTTASGALRVGLPFGVETGTSGRLMTGSCHFTGWTKANYTQITPVGFPGFDYLQFRATGSGQAGASLSTGDLPTGAAIEIDFHISYQKDV